MHESGAQPRMLLTWPMGWRLYSRTHRDLRSRRRARAAHRIFGILTATPYHSEEIMAEAAEFSKLERNILKAKGISDEQIAALVLVCSNRHGFASFAGIGV